MEKFKITIVETLEREVEVEAKTKEEAFDIVEKQYKNEEIILDADDFTEKNISYTNDNEMVKDKKGKVIGCSCGSKDFTVEESSCHSGEIDDGKMYLLNEEGQGFTKSVCDGCGKADETMDYPTEY